MHRRTAAFLAIYCYVRLFTRQHITGMFSVELFAVIIVHISIIGIFAKCACG